MGSSQLRQYFLKIIYIGSVEMNLKQALQLILIHKENNEEADKIIRDIHNAKEKNQ